MGPNFVLDKGFQATGAIRKFRCVELNAVDKANETNTTGEFSVGVCQEEISAADATSGRIADIRILGITRVIVDAAYPIQTRVRAKSDGKATALAATTLAQNQIGVLLAASAADGDQVDMLLTVGAQAGT